MAEAEDVIVDAARHATVYARSLWRRHRPAPQGFRELELADVAQRIELLLSAVFGAGFALRVAQPPAPRTLLETLFTRKRGPVANQALPATDGVSLWLPRRTGLQDPQAALERFRTLALIQAMRAERGSARFVPLRASRLAQSIYLVLEAAAADHELVRRLPGVAASVAALRSTAVADRPALSTFPADRRPLEAWLRGMVARPGTPEDLRQAALGIEAVLLAEGCSREARVLEDLWIGRLLAPSQASRHAANGTEALSGEDDPDAPAAGSARLARTPEVREGEPDEDDGEPGPWMVQTAQPHESAEDPMGLTRPTDRDAETAAEDFAESVADLPQARLVAAPGKPREYLLSEDMPQAARHGHADDPQDATRALLSYPEWDWRSRAYRHPGATVHLLAPRVGDDAWVTRTLDAHRAMLGTIRRRFEMLRAQRVRVHRQLDGEEIDLDAAVEAHAEYRAGLPRSQRIYQSTRPARRDLAVLLLIDVSGSTDAWVAGGRRVIDVEKEALLLVCLALEGMAQPYAVQAFSGDGPQRVTVRELKAFDEPYSGEVARRVAALEPERYTRAGAAIRHASAGLMRQAARHRLLLLLSDGKPNDVDDYEGRYGLEDMRQAVTEARLQGINAFCLTIDRQAAAYLPKVFGLRQYALLKEPTALPAALLDWMRRLVTS